MAILKANRERLRVSSNQKNKKILEGLSERERIIFLAGGNVTVQGCSWIGREGAEKGYVPKLRGLPIQDENGRVVVATGYLEAYRYGSDIRSEYIERKFQILEQEAG